MVQLLTVCLFKAVSQILDQNFLRLKISSLGIWGIPPSREGSFTNLCLSPGNVFQNSSHPLLLPVLVMTGVMFQVPPAQLCYLCPAHLRPVLLCRLEVSIYSEASVLTSSSSDNM